MSDFSELLSDRDWRLSHLYSVRDEMGVKGPFRFRAFQWALYQSIWWLNQILKARQLGFSTFIELFFADRMFFNPGQEIGIVDVTLPDAKKKLDKVRYAWESVGYGIPGADLTEKKRINRFVHSIADIVTDSKTEIRFSNGSGIYASVSHRGGSLQGTHVSEFGAIAHYYPTKALEILDGVGPASHGPVFFESTHKGGKFGENYRLIKSAMANQALPPEEWNKKTWKFHFFPWWQMPEYRIHSPKRLGEEALLHFEELERDGIHLDEPQKRWWQTQKETYGLRMGHEYPSRPSDAFEAPIEGAIYGTIIANLRAKGLVGKDFEADSRLPVFVAMDLGWSDYCSLWAVQPTSTHVFWLDWHQASDQGPGYYASIIREWRQRYPIAGILLPHDAWRKGGGDYSGTSFSDHFLKAGFNDLIRVPQTHDVWAGIGELREILRRSVFHARCCKRRIIAGEEAPAGIDHLESYRKHQALEGETIREMPIHDEHSHSADAGRTFAEAYAAGLISKHHRVRDRRDRDDDRASRRQAILG